MIIKIKYWLSDNNYQYDINYEVYCDVSCDEVSLIDMPIPFYKNAHLPGSRVCANDSGDWGSILGRVIPKTQKMVLDIYLFA